MRTLIAILGLLVVATGQPARALINVGDLDTPGQARDVEVVGGLAYVANDSYGVKVIDVSDPASPVELGALETPSLTLGVEIAGGLVYVAAYSFGLRVMDFGPEYMQTPEPLPTLSPWSQPVLVMGLLAVGLGAWRWRAARIGAIPMSLRAD